MRYLNKEPPEFQIKIVSGCIDTTANAFEKHQEVIIVDLNCGNAPSIFAKVN